MGQLCITKCTTMKAIQYTTYGAPETVPEMVHIPTPAPLPGQIRIKVRAAGVNPSDWKRMEGQYTGFEEVVFPSGVGVEASGTLDAIGDGAEGVRIGDAVRRGLRVIGTASERNHDYLRSLGAIPTYGEGLAARVKTLAPEGIAGALDIAARALTISAQKQVRGKLMIVVD